MTETPTPDLPDGYPPPPLDGTLADLQRYERVFVLAEALRLTEATDLAMIYGEPNDAPRATPAEWWARAETALDEGHAEYERNAHV